MQQRGNKSGIMEMTWSFLPFYFMKIELFILLSMLILYLKIVHAKISFLGNVIKFYMHFKYSTKL